MRLGRSRHPLCVERRWSTMFGRFGRGGGNFVAQYRVYPVSFVDKVRPRITAGSLSPRGTLPTHRSRLFRHHSCVDLDDRSLTPR